MQDELQYTFTIRQVNMEQVREYFSNESISGLIWGSVIVAMVLSFIHAIMGGK